MRFSRTDAIRFDSTHPQSNQATPTHIQCAIDPPPQEKRGPSAPYRHARRWWRSGSGTWPTDAIQFIQPHPTPIQYSPATNLHHQPTNASVICHQIILQNTHRHARGWWRSGSWPAGRRSAGRGPSRCRGSGRRSAPSMSACLLLCHVCVVGSGCLCVCAVAGLSARGGQV